MDTDLDWFFGNCDGSVGSDVPPENYESLNTALSAIVGYAPNSTGFGARGAVNWHSAEQLLAAELDTLNLRGEVYSKIYKALKAHGYYAGAARLQVVQYGNSRWSELSSDLRHLALESFADKNILMPSTAFQDVIKDFPLLANDEAIVDHVINLIKNRHSELDVALLQLQALNGNNSQLRQVFRAIGAAGYHSAPHQFSILCAEWAGVSTFGNLQHVLWYAPSKKQYDEAIIELEVSSQPPLAG